MPLLVANRYSCLITACAATHFRIRQNVDDDNEDITRVDDESVSNWDDGRGEVGDKAAKKQIVTIVKKEMKIFPDCDSDNREHGLLLESEDKQLRKIKY